MNLLSRIFARTPSLRTRVVLATAIGAAIPVLIVGTVVWVGITADRKERLDRRLDEAAGFAIPFVPRGLDEIPRSPNDQDALITVRRGSVVKSNSDITLPKLQPTTPTPTSAGCDTGCGRSRSRDPSRRRWPWARRTTPLSPRPTTCIAECC